MFFYSDEEGSAPFKFPQAVNGELIVDTEKTQDDVRKKLTDHFSLTEDGLIDGFAPGSQASVAFLGDLVDRAPCNIRATLNLLKMKEDFPGRVVLIGGNRDFNKVRMASDFGIVHNLGGNVLDAANFKDGGVFFGLDFWGVCDRVATSFGKDKDFRFARTGAELMKYLESFGNAFWVAGKQLVPAAKLDDADNLTRVDENNETGGIFKTFGVSNFIVDARYHELTQSVYSDPNAMRSRDFMRVAFCLSSMLFGEFWDETLINNLFPNIDDVTGKFLNGLYLNYVEKCHIIAHVTYKGKNCVLTHAGMVPMLTHPILLNGVVKKMKDPSATSLKIVIEKVNGNVKKLVDSIKFKINTLPRVRAAMKNLFVFLTATCTHAQYTSNDAPIAREYRKGEESEVLRFKQQGGSDDALELSDLADNDNPFVLYAENVEKGKVTDEQVVHYNIYGHRPQGMIPLIVEATDPESPTPESTTHVCLDVSRGESVEVASNDSFAMLYMHGNEARVIGSFRVFGQADKLIIVEADKLTKLMPDGAKYGAVNQLVSSVPPKESIQVYYDKTVPEFLIQSERTPVTNSKGETEEITMFTISDRVWVKMVGWANHIRVNAAAPAPPLGGGRTPKNTKTKVSVGRRECVLYKDGNAKFVKCKGAFVKLSDARKLAR